MWLRLWLKWWFCCYANGRQCHLHHTTEKNALYFKARHIRTLLSVVPCIVYSLLSLSRLFFCFSPCLCIHFVYYKNLFYFLLKIDWSVVFFLFPFLCLCCFCFILSRCCSYWACKCVCGSKRVGVTMCDFFFASVALM